MDLRASLPTIFSVFVGQQGWQITLINACSGIDLRVGPFVESSGQWHLYHHYGQAFHLPDGGYLIDSPVSAEFG